ncbi:short-chain dehydrogenase [Arenicella chitinivorans]|uniref:Short-chain dehydrogenase n=1 Tax=Arenicella chitinivorans TaxID=1329800 RepID=A0A918RLE4_9GAMM|nr:SDR family NAD(P)-dependent oxidoreductase [Arenicella chitinivorans]GHA01619.1 short-chain dehydrogenase [Arenicella chitinivorans]
MKHNKLKPELPKRALVTGASTGIGLAVAQGLHKSGYTVDGIARGKPAQVSDWLTMHQIDLSKINTLPDKLRALSLDHSVLVLNAGYGRFGGLEQFSYSQIQHLLDTNLTSNVFLIKHFLPHLKRAGGGDVVIIGSESALQGGPAGAVYCASKFALRGLAQSLRADCAGNNIRVMLINPGPVATEFFAETSFEPKSGEVYSLTAEQVAESVLHAIQQPRNVVIEEINLQPMHRSFQKK